MKGIRLIINILIPFSLVLFVWVGVVNYSNSLSGHHMTKFDPILYACLLSIYTLMFATSTTSKAKETILAHIDLKIVRGDFRAEHALRYCAAFFGGVIIFGVNNFETLFFNVSVHHLHFVFTSLAIVFGYLFMMLLPSNKNFKRVTRWFLLIFGFVAFFLGFAFDLYSVTWAEFFVALPISFAIYKFIQK